MYEYVVVSDWHIGSGVSQSAKIIKMLKTIETKVLILNGDIIDIDHTKRLNKHDWKILGMLRKLSKYTRIIYLPGNHDHTVYETISEFIGLEHYKSFNFDVASKRYHVVHGNLFDHFITKHWLVTEIATGLYYWLQRLSPKTHSLARALKRKSKSFIRCCDKLKDNAIAYAKYHKYDYIVCGHTHHPEISGNYINSGCFTEVECTYIGVTESGEISLIHV
jgi:UDP-2,3-diacylglucosamine pyrophosphatase LpxH